MNNASNPKPKFVSKLTAYLAARALIERRMWRLADEYYEGRFVHHGCREFEGVVLDNAGNITADREYPEFFTEYRRRQADAAAAAKAKV